MFYTSYTTFSLVTAKPIAVESSQCIGWYSQRRQSFPRKSSTAAVPTRCTVGVERVTSRPSAAQFVVFCTAFLPLAAVSVPLCSRCVCRRVCLSCPLSGHGAALTARPGQAHTGKSWSWHLRTSKAWLPLTSSRSWSWHLQPLSCRQSWLPLAPPAGMSWPPHRPR